MTTAPQPDDRDEVGVEQRICAVCQHEESAHELLDTGAQSRMVCRVCDDAHAFQPLPD